MCQLIPSRTQDVIDTLEKRVKSRFSQNVICLGHPKTFEAYLDFIRTALEGAKAAAVAAPPKKYLQSVKVGFGSARTTIIFICR